MEKSLELSFDEVSINTTGYDIDDIIKLIRVITNSNDTEIEPKRIKITKSSDVEEINIKELRTVRYPKTTSNFRCPSCGQGILIYVEFENKQILLVRDISVERPIIYDVNIEQLPNLSEGGVVDKKLLIAVYNDLLTLKEDEKVLVDSDRSSAKCPLCHETHDINEWIEAYDNPMKYLDRMNICDVCGEEGEILITQTGDSLVCENKCIEKIKA